MWVPPPPPPTLWSCLKPCSHTLGWRGAMAMYITPSPGVGGLGTSELGDGAQCIPELLARPQERWQDGSSGVSRGVVGSAGKVGRARAWPESCLNTANGCFCRSPQGLEGIQQTLAVPPTQRLCKSWYCLMGRWWGGGGGCRSQFSSCLTAEMESFLLLA